VVAFVEDDRIELSSKNIYSVLVNKFAVSAATLITLITVSQTLPDLILQGTKGVR
jgi:hypothetical protein